MPVPATKGSLKSRITDMKIGDYIPFHYNGATYAEGIGGKIECPVNGVAVANRTNYFWYMVKVAQGLLISDRIWNHSQSWDDLNGQRYIQGRKFQTPDGVEITIRSLTGGVAYADENGNMSLTDKNLGAFPSTNEWDKYIVNFPQKLIQEGKTLDDVFHWSNKLTWCQETPANGVIYVDGSGNQNVAVNTRRVRRGWRSLETLSHGLSTAIDSNIGFRPIFQYQEG